MSIPVPTPTFNLSIVVPGGFEGANLNSQPLTFNDADAAIRPDTARKFGCTYIGCTFTGTADKMKNMDTARVEGGVLAPVCPDHGKEVEETFGIGLYPLLFSIKIAVDRHNKIQRHALMARFLLPAPATTHGRVNGTSTHRLELAAAAR